MTMNNPAGVAETTQSEEGSEAIDFTYDDSSRPTIARESAAEMEASETEASTDADETGGETEGEDGQSEAENQDKDGGEKSGNKVPAKDRIKQLADQRNQARTRASEAEQRAARAEKQSATLQAQLAELQNRPKPREAEDYDTDSEYTEALIAESVAAGEERALKRAADQALRERQEAAFEAWEEKTESIRQRAPDFEDVVTNERLPVTEIMRDAIMAENNGPEVLYFLGKNPKEAGRIAKMQPLQQAAAIGRLAERVSAPTTKKTTTAPNPTKRLSGHGQTPPRASPDKMSNAEYRAMREKQMAERARRF